jgi:hypothetical protein
LSKIASAFTVPPSTCGLAVVMISQRKSMRPPCRSCIAGPVPRYGTWVMSVPST